MNDPRTTSRGNLKHSLSDIIFLVISAVVCGYVDWTEIEIFGKMQIDWLRKFVPLKNGIPSHDTLGRVFGSIDFEEFSNCFIDWTTAISDLTDKEVVAIDGKCIRNSYDKATGLKAIHMVSAFASENGITLGQVACEAKSNEITAIPKLLDLLAIKGATVTIDAIGCQTNIVEKIREKKANYIIAAKKNQKELSEQIEKKFNITKPSSKCTDTEADHGRIETRTCSVINDLKFMDDIENWKDLKSIIKIESERFIKLDGKTQRQTRYYISNLDISSEDFLKKIRSHWGIENNLHWMMYVMFKEDYSRKRKDNSAKNFNLISKVVFKYDK